MFALDNQETGWCPRLERRSDGERRCRILAEVERKGFIRNRASEHGLGLTIVEVRRPTRIPGHGEARATVKSSVTLVELNGSNRRPPEYH